MKLAPGLAPGVREYDVTGVAIGSRPHVEPAYPMRIVFVPRHLRLWREREAPWVLQLNYAKHSAHRTLRRARFAASLLAMDTLQQFSIVTK